MTVNVEVVKNPNESTNSLVRRFTKRVQGSGVVKEVRGQRYEERVKSRNVQRKRALKRIKRWQETALLRKMGKIL